MDRDKLIKDLFRDEDFRRSAYEDSEGYLTIGIGRCIDPRLGQGITKPEAEMLLLNDISNVEAELDANLSWWRDLPEPAARGLANMAFQLGLPRLKSFKKMLAALEARDFETAAKEALDSKWARQTPYRALRIAQRFRDSTKE